jgi:hypothetical protein
MVRSYQSQCFFAADPPPSQVQLGRSGLKVSKLILGCLAYGTPEWAGWVLGEEEGITHIKAAYDAGINAFDTANVRVSTPRRSRVVLTVGRGHLQIYSNGLSEVILGKAIKQHNLPRDEIVVMTKVRMQYNGSNCEQFLISLPQVSGVVCRSHTERLSGTTAVNPDDLGYVNQASFTTSFLDQDIIVYSHHVRTRSMD